MKCRPEIFYLHNLCSKCIHWKCYLAEVVKPHNCVSGKKGFPKPSSSKNAEISKLQKKKYIYIYIYILASRTVSSSLACIHLRIRGNIRPKFANNTRPTALKSGSIYLSHATWHSLSLGCRSKWLNISFNILSNLYSKYMIMSKHKFL